MSKLKTTTSPDGKILISPDDPALLLDESENTRARKYTKTEIADRANTLLQDGQLQPVELRETEEGYKVTFGVGRILGARKLLEDGHKIKLWVTINNADNETAFIRSVKENLERKETNAIDDALNIQKLITPVDEGGFGYTQKQAAELYRCTPASVSQKLKLLTLPSPMQTSIIKGELPMRLALDLASIDSPNRQQKAYEKYLEQLKGTAGKSSTSNKAPRTPASVIREALRAERSGEADEDDTDDSGGSGEGVEDSSDTGEGDSSEKPPKKTRSRKNRTVQRSLQEVRDFWEQYTQTGSAYPDQIRDFARDVVNYMDGKIGDGDLQEALIMLYDFSVAPDEEEEFV